MTYVIEIGVLIAGATKSVLSSTFGLWFSNQGETCWGFLFRIVAECELFIHKIVKKRAIISFKFQLEVDSSRDYMIRRFI